MPYSKNWESGIIRINPNDWKELKTQLIKTHNDLLDFAFEKSMETYNQLKKLENKEKIFVLANKHLEKSFSISDHNIHYFSLLSLFEKNNDGWCIKTKLQKPDIEVFNIKKHTIDDLNIDFYTGELTISLHDDRCYLGWHITDNVPNSIDIGRNSTLGKSCINILNNINWNENYGGYIELYDCHNLNINPLKFGNNESNNYFFENLLKKPA